MPDRPAPALYIVYLGGEPAAGRMGEDHEVVAVVARTVKEARAAARAKWQAPTRPHVDAVRALRVVDGHRIRVEWTGEGEDAEVDLTYEP